MHKSKHCEVTLEQNGSAGEKSCTVQPKLSIVGVDISHCSQRNQFLICSLGVFVFYLFYGYSVELILTNPALKAHGLYLTFYQFVLYSVFGFVEFRILEGNSQKKIPTRTYLLLAFLTVATMGLSNSSLAYLNFPTQVIFKSCKLIPVLIGGILIQNKKYGLVDFVAAFVMCVGLAWFTLADSQTSPNFHLTGIVMISLALLADAVIGNVQEKTMKLYGASNSEVVLYSYFFGLFYLIAFLVISGQLVPSIRVSLQYPREIYFYGFLFSVTGYLGINIVLTLVRTCGAFAAVTVTTFRKAITIALSFVLFTKPFTFHYVLSGMLVLAGVYISVVGKRGLPRESSLQRTVQKISQLCHKTEALLKQRASSLPSLHNV